VEQWFVEHTMVKISKEGQMSYFTVNRLHHWLYSIYDPRGSYCYLALGNDKALLFDTGYGIASLHDAISKLTDKPVVTVLGHGHVDHANGAYQFEEVWLHEADFDLFQEHTSKQWRRGIAAEPEKGKTTEDFDVDDYINAPAPKLRKLEAGHVFNLGDLHMDAIGMEGHTPGSIGLLAREHRVLLNSDSANSHIWMHLPGSLPISQYTAMLERVLTLDFDIFYTGHSDKLHPKSELLKYIQVARNASIEKAEPYEMFDGFLYQEDGVGIVFNRDTLR